MPDSIIKADRKFCQVLLDGSGQFPVPLAIMEGGKVIGAITGTTLPDFDRLEVCDSAPGFPADFEPLHAANKGLERIPSLAKWDLRRTITIENCETGGGRIVAVFPLSFRRKITMKYQYEELARMLDHALLTPTMTDAELEAGCRVAAEYGLATVCVKPYFVARAAELLRGSGVGVGTVIGFPHGSSAAEVKRYETEIACRDGATEVDMVINNGKVFSGDWDYVTNDIRIVVEEAHRHGALIKVIFETDYLPDDALKTRICQICAEVNADFVKTSTGFGFVKGADGKYFSQGATEHDLILMREVCPPTVRVKASGGVRDLDTLIRCRDLGCARVGASASAAMLDEYRRRAAEPETTDSATTGTLGTGGY